MKLGASGSWTMGDVVTGQKVVFIVMVKDRDWAHNCPNAQHESRGPTLAQHIGLGVTPAPCRGLTLTARAGSSAPGSKGFRGGGHHSWGIQKMRHVEEMSPLMALGT